MGDDSTSSSQVRETAMADEGVFRSGIMLRIGKTEEIVRQYEEGYLRFSCPGNWIMYAKKNHDDGIADRYEAIFAHVKRDDPRLLEAFKNDPTEMAWSLWGEAGPDDTIYARYVHSCLVPTVCFYSVDVKDVARYFGLPIEKGNWVEVDLMPYYEALGIKNREEYSILAIHSVSDLVEELRREIPKLISDMQFIEKRHFNPENALAVGYVKYDLDLNEEFIDPYPYKALFRKRPEFREQREARMVIPRVNYLRHPYEFPDKWEDHEMKVPVPGLKAYAKVIPAAKCERYRYVF